MSLRVRRAVLETDRAELTELHRRCLSPRADLQRFDWLYCGSPHGAARAWVSYDDQSGAVVGTAAAFPRKMYFDAVERIGWVLGDFCFEGKYRSLGPALQLQRVCLESVTAAPFEFCYDFPSASMMAIYKRLGISEIGKVVRWARPLRLDRRLQARLRPRVLVRAVSGVGNVLLAWRGRKADKNCCELNAHEGPCGHEFDVLDQKMRGQRGIRTARSAEYLNWRYLANSQAKHEILTARRGGSLIGYTAFTQRGEDAHIVDLCCMEEPAVVARLLSGAVELLRMRGVATVSMNAGDWHPWKSIFEQAGFRRREASPVVVHSAAGASSSRAPAPPAWYLMQGERDT